MQYRDYLGSGCLTAWFLTGASSGNLDTVVAYNTTLRLYNPEQIKPNMGREGVSALSGTQDKVIHWQVREDIKI